MTNNMPVRTKDTQFINTIQELNNFCINNPSFFFKLIGQGFPCILINLPTTLITGHKKKKKKKRRWEKVPLIPKEPIPSFRKQFDS